MTILISTNDSHGKSFKAQFSLPPGSHGSPLHYHENITETFEVLSGVGLAMLKSRLFKPWVGWVGLFTVPFWIIGQSELLTTAIPSIPKWEVTPIGFTIWEIWLLVIGIFLLRVKNKQLT